MQQGEIWWADLGAPLARRPVAVVSSGEIVCACPNTVVVARITTRIRETPSEVRLGAEDGLPQTVINTEMLHTIPRSDLVSRIALLSEAKREQLEHSLRYVLGINGSPPAASQRSLAAQPSASRPPANPQLPAGPSRLHFGGRSFDRPFR